LTIERARELVGGIEDLPTLPEVVIEITRMVENPDTTAEDIYRIVSTDVSLSATMLKLVNSAFYGMSKSVTSLEKAIRILGFSTVRNIALAAFVFDAFLTGKGQFDYKAFWVHSIGTGAAAEVLARRQRLKETGDFFCYGLLHDLGVVVLMQYLPEELVKVRGLIAKGERFCEAHEQVLGCTHKELGAALADQWDFPPMLVSVIGSQGCAELPREFSREIAITTCAEAVASALEIGSSIDYRVVVVTPAVWEAAGVRPEDLGAIMDETLAEMEHSGSFIELLYR